MRSHTEPPARHGHVATWVYCAVLGMVAGFAVRATVVLACDCAPPSWNLRLDAVTSTDDSVSHAAYWPRDASLWGHERYFGFDAYPRVPDRVDALSCGGLGEP